MSRGRAATGAVRRAIVVALAVVGVTTAALVAPTPGAGAGVAAVDPPAVTVLLTSVSPVSVTPGQTLTLHGSVAVGAGGATGVHLVVGVGDPVSSRDALARELGTTTPTSPSPPTSPSSPSPPSSSSTAGTSGVGAPDLETVLTDCPDCLAGHATDIAAGRSVAFAVTVPVGRDLARSVVSVYPLVVRVVGTSGDDVATTLGEADSWLPYFPGSVAAPLRVSWLWPLDPAPVLAADGSVAAADFPTTLGAGGSLGSQLAATTRSGRPGEGGLAPVTYAVEPSLLDAAALTAHAGWHRSNDAPGAAPHPASADAAAFLAALHAATRGNGVVALPYADPDAPALVHAGLALDLTNALATGRSDVQLALPDADVLAGVDWAPGSAVDQAELDAYAGAGTTTLVLPGAQLAVPDDAATPTVTAVTSLATKGPTVRGLVTDPDAEALIGDGGHGEPTPAMAAQRLLALLAVIVAEAPNSAAGSRDVVLAVPRGSDPSAGWARSMLGATGSVEWLDAVPLSATADDASAARDPLASYPASAQMAELPAATLTGARTGVVAVRASVTDAGSLFPDSTTATQTTKPLDLALARAESYAWRADPAGSAALRADTAVLAHDLVAKVGLASASTVTLASGKSSIPVTVDNGLNHAVTVSLDLSSLDHTKLAPVQRTVSVPAGHKQRVLLPAHVDRAGTFRATITLSTPSGLQITAAPIVVHSKAYGALTLAITFGALGVLVLALVVRGARRIRHRVRPDAAV